MNFNTQEEAAKKLAYAATEEKNRFLTYLADHLRANKQAIINTNKKDIRAGMEAGLKESVLDRLTLTETRIDDIADGVLTIRALPDPIGEVIEGSIRPNGLKIERIRVPLGVIGFIFESRPNVVIDAAALAVKSGNAIILKGGHEARYSNKLFGEIITQCLQEAGLPKDAVFVIDHDPDRSMFKAMLESKAIKVLVPRGGKGLIKAVTEGAKMPVLKHMEGICHLYVSDKANLKKAVSVVVNAKAQRPGVCNALETVLVHQYIAESFLPQLAKELEQEQVEIRGCPKTCKILKTCKPATEEDWSTEYLDLIISIKIVESMSKAVLHIDTYSSKHSDGIISENFTEIQEFISRVDTAGLFVNASTRFHDGFEFGLGAELGISTDKFHARGPMGLRELTSYKWIVTGDGHIRT